MNKMKKTVIFIGVILVLIITLFLLYNFQENEKTNKLNLLKKEEIINNIDEKVLTLRKAKLYDKDLQQIGEVGNNIFLKLDITEKNEYLKIKDKDYYIYYTDVENANDFEEDLRYQKYIPWDESVVTNDTTIFYSEHDSLAFNLNESLTLPIIIKREDKLGVEYNNQLYFIKEYKEVINIVNSELETRDNIRTLTYHTIYDKSKGDVCISSQICLDINKFENHLKYIVDNDYLALTMEEIEMFVDKEIRIPKNSIALTLDDGLLLENAVPLLEKYKVHATFFIITSQGDFEKYLGSKYARFESHTHDMHQNYKCPKAAASSQGGMMICWPVDEIVEDLKISQEKLRGSYYFAYPFFDHYGNAIKAVKEAGFRLAFVGEKSKQGYSTYDTDRYLMLRKTVFDTHSMDTFISFLQ